jgi:hypothetical protein
MVMVATLVAIAVRRVRLPYTVSLVLVGLFLSVQRFVVIEVAAISMAVVHLARSLGVPRCLGRRAAARPPF